MNDALPPPVAEEELKVFIAISVLAIGVPSSFAKLVAVKRPVTTAPVLAVSNFLLPLKNNRALLLGTN